MFLNEKLARQSWPIEAFMGAVFKRRGGDSLGMGHGFKSATNWLDFSFNFASRLPRFSPRFSSRSGHDRASIVVLVLLQSPSIRPAMIPRRNLLDRGSIAPRSRFDRAAIVEFFHMLPTSSDRNPTLHRSSQIGILLAIRSKSYAPAMWPLDR